MFNAISTPQITMLIIWFIIIVLGIILEEVTSSLVSIWFSIAAAISLVFAIADFDIYIQIIVFAVLSLVLILATRPLVKKLTHNTEVKTNVDKLFGMVGKVIEKIEKDNKGIVKVDFQEWTAVSYKNVTIEEGTNVVIKGIVGNKLIVDVIEDIEIK